MDKSRRIGLSDVSQHLGKLPPQAVEIEEAILGALMLERDACAIVMEILEPEHFYKDAHQEIMEAIVQLYKNSEPIDIKTVCHQLRKTAKLEVVGGNHYVAELTTKINSASNIEHHAYIVKEQALKREVIRLTSELQKEAYEDAIDVFELIAKLEKSVISIGDTIIHKDFVKIDGIVSESVKEILDDDREVKEITGVPCGIQSVDKLTAGWQPTDLIIIAARPGMGKTAYVVSAIRNAAMDYQIPVAMFSLEMSSVQLVNRLLSSEAEIPSDRLRKKNIYHTEIEGFVDKAGKVQDLPIWIDDTPGLTILEFRSKCRRMVMQHNVKLIVVDYLQLMRGDKEDRRGNREQEIASIARSLKIVAKELNVPVIALSQLSRAVETRGGDKRPQLSDLRESGSIEQDADLVAFLYRPEYYGIDSDENGMPLNGLGEFIIAKHRNGDLDTAMMKFIGKFTKWTDEIPPEGQFPTMKSLQGNTDFTITLPSARDTTGETKQDDQPFN